jgi:hypothetical protein
VNVGRSQSQFTSALLEDDSSGVDFLKLFGDGCSAVWAPIVDDYDFVVEVTMKCQREGGSVVCHTSP